MVQVRTQGANGQPDHFEVTLPEGSRVRALKEAIERARGPASFAADRMKLIVAGVGLLSDHETIPTARPVVCISQPRAGENTVTPTLPGYKYKAGDVAWWAADPAQLIRQKVIVNQPWSHKAGMYHIQMSAGGHGKTVST